MPGRERMPKILIVGLNFYPELTGIGRYTGEVAAYLAAYGFQVRVVTPPRYYPHWRIQPGYQAWGYRRETWQEVEIRRCPLWIPRRPRSWEKETILAGFRDALEIMMGGKRDLKVILLRTICIQGLPCSSLRLVRRSWSSGT